MPTPPPERDYGVHLVLDGYGGDPRRLYDLSLLFDVLDRLPAKIGMTKIGFPHLIRIEEPAVAGISGFVFILESHISIHTYPLKGFLSMDAYSCRPFDTDAVVDEVRSTYGLTEVEPQVLRRGRRFPIENIHPEDVLR